VPGTNHIASPGTARCACLSWVAAGILLHGIHISLHPAGLAAAVWALQVRTAAASRLHQCWGCCHSHLLVLSQPVSRCAKPFAPPGAPAHLQHLRSQVEWAAPPLPVYLHTIHAPGEQ
jgi:hypothetical protein